MNYNDNKDLITALQACIAACNHCTIACLDEDDVKMMTSCIKLDIDCAEICQLTLNFITRSSVHASHLLGECAEICNACADECEKHAKHGMQHCRDCAEACRKCASACGEMVTA